MTKFFQDKKILHELVTMIGIFIGTSFYALGLVAVNIPNNLAEGGVTGITLILRYWFNLDPAISTILINIPLILIGYRVLGKKAIFWTIWGTVSLSIALFIWQRIPIISQLNLEHDLFIAGILAGIIGGFGVGIVFKFGGTTGGTDILARIIELKFGWPMGKSLLIFDILVLTASLSYLDIKHMMYTLLATTVFATVINFIQDGSYSAKGIYIISDKYEEISKMIDLQLNRGFTFLQAEGGYDHSAKKIIYCVISSNELPQLKEIIKAEDENAFYSVMNVHEIAGEGFSYNRKKTRLFMRK